jgi:SAM-dependent methyltransferase
MDLRQSSLSKEQISTAASVLNYQPFIISDELQTGAAYSWAYGRDPRIAPTLVFKKSIDNQIWDQVTDSNGRLRKMYDDFILEITSRYPSGTFLDVACNNGYFPAAAAKLGMRRTKGIDLGGQYRDSLNFLNEILGTRAEFEQVNYDPLVHASRLSEKFDVVSAVAIMCHLPDPMNFLAYLGSLANEAIFFMGQVIDTDAFIVSHWKPHGELGRGELPFPYRFNDNSRLSRGLLFHGFEQMGFKNILELPWRKEWLSPYFAVNYNPATKPDLETEIKTGSKHIAVLATR